MKYFKTYEAFKKDYMKKIDLKDFKKIKKGSKIMYMGGEAEVLDNNGFVLKLKGEDGKTFSVNKSMFDHGGMIKENLGKTLKKAYMAFKKHFKKSVFHSGPSKLFNIVPPTSADYETAEEWVKTNGEKGDMIRMIGVDEILGKIHINYGKVANDMGTDVSIDRPLGNEESPIAHSGVIEGIVKDLEDGGWQVDYLSDADRKTKSIWKKAGVDPNDEDNIILYSYVNSWPETHDFLKKNKIKYKELEDPNSAGESFIVFKVNEASSEKDGTKASDGKHKHEDHLEEDMEAMWKKAYGENFASKYPGVAKIIKQRKIKDPREIARIWQETYGEDFKEEYPAIWDMLSK